jgi:hypothetical protein
LCASHEPQLLTLFAVLSAFFAVAVTLALSPPLPGLKITTGETDAMNEVIVNHSQPARFGRSGDDAE